MIVKGAILPASVLVVAVMAAAVVSTPALAQTSDPAPDYVLEKDGTVAIDGDGATDCRSFASFLKEGSFESGDTLSAGAQRVLEQCVEAGLLEAELAASAGAPATASPLSEGSAANGEDGGLPDTGGPDLPALPAAASLLVSAGLLFRWARS